MRHQGTFPIAALGLASLLMGCHPVTSSPTHAVQFFPSPDPALAALPFSEAVRVGDLLFLSGQIGSKPGTLGLVPGGFAPEATQALENIRLILQRHGSSPDRVVKCTVFLADIHDWPAFNEIYRQYFKAPFPARSALAANGLALGSRVEIECVATVVPQP